MLFVYLLSSFIFQLSEEHTMSNILFDTREFIIGNIESEVVFVNCFSSFRHFIFFNENSNHCHPDIGKNNKLNVTGSCVFFEIVNGQMNKIHSVDSDPW